MELQPFPARAQTYLEGRAFQVSRSNAYAGLEAQRHAPAEVVVTDIFMPNCNGFETLERLRSGYPDAKVLVVSGGGARARGPGYLFTAREIGAHAVLAKPFDNEALLGAVRGLLQ